MKNEKLYQACEKALPAYIANWEKLVNVDCGSRNGKSINQVADLLWKELEPLQPFSLEKIPRKAAICWPFSREKARGK